MDFQVRMLLEMVQEALEVAIKSKKWSK